MIEIPDFMEEDLRKKARMYFKILKNRCKFCNHDGIIINGDFYKNCQCTIEFNNCKKYLYANFPLDYMNITLEDLKKTYELLCIDAYTKILNNLQIIINKGYNILFRKKNDKSWGITTAGTLFCKKAIDLGYGVFIVDSLSMFDTFFSFGDDKEQNKKKSKVFSFYNNVPVLMIDGFGTEGYKKDKNSFVFTKFLTVLNQRKALGKVTIICSNLQWFNIEKDYDISLVRFLKNEMLNFPISCIKDRNRGNMEDKLSKEIPELKNFFNRDKPKGIPGTLKSDPKLDKLI